MQALTAQGNRTNEIAKAVKAGKADILLLWLSCRRYIFRMANRWGEAFKDRKDVDIDDLEQVGFLALVWATETWDPESGAFTTFLTYRLKTAFAAALGLRTEKGRREPLNSAVSLDLPPAGADEDCSLGDLIPDELAGRAFEDIETKDLCEAVREAVRSLPEDQQAAIIGEFWYGQRPDPKARSRALRALRHPTISRTLKTYYS